MRTPVNIWAAQPGIVEQLTALVAEGLSFSIIAQRLGGGLTRNACIGKARRMGLVSVNEGGSRKGREWREPRPPTLRAPTLKRAPLPIPTTPMPDALRIPMLQLLSVHCRWPLWGHNEPSGDFPHCGLPSTVGPYCVHHARDAFTPQRPKKAVAA